MMVYITLPSTKLYLSQHQQSKILIPSCINFLFLQCCRIEMVVNVVSKCLWNAAQDQECRISEHHLKSCSSVDHLPSTYILYAIKSHYKSWHNLDISRILVGKDEHSTIKQGMLIGKLYKRSSEWSPSFQNQQGSMAGSNHLNCSSDHNDFFH